MQFTGGRKTRGEPAGVGRRRRSRRSRRPHTHTHTHTEPVADWLARSGVSSSFSSYLSTLFLPSDLFANVATVDSASRTLLVQFSSRFVSKRSRKSHMRSRATLRSQKMPGLKCLVCGF